MNDLAVKLLTLISDNFYFCLRSSDEELEEIGMKRLKRGYGFNKVRYAAVYQEKDEKEVKKYFLAIDFFLHFFLFKMSKQKRLTKYNYGMYHEVWQRFDPEDTKYIRLDQLYDFLDALKPPLRVPKPNKFKSIAMDIPICQGDLMYCDDILDAVKTEFYAQRGVFDERSYEDRFSRPDVAGYENLSSTLWRNREEYSARIIQQAWRKYRLREEGDNDEAEDSEEEEDEAGLGDLNFILLFALRDNNLISCMYISL